MGAGIRWSGFGLGLILASMVAGSAPSVLAEIRATDKNGLRTEVNGLRGGRCNKGICRIGGGTNAGKNKFHRFKNFDTRGAITRVEFDTGGKNNLIVGVTSPSGSWINKALSMSSKANLFFLSPGGLHVGKGAEFINVPKLTLSTADQLKFSEGVFDVFGSTPSSIQDFRTNPLPGVFGLRRSEMEEPVELAAGELPGIHLDGINISLDEELVVDAPGGRVDVTNSRLNVGTEEIGGRIALTGDVILIDSQSELVASGMFGGGLIEVGGSWQNSDASVRQAISVIIENGALLDASAKEQGDGGEIVAWSDVNNPQSITTVAGTLLATGGREGGNGGAIETSGFELNVAGIDVDAKASRGDQGLWLLDPFDYTLDNNSFETSTIASVLSNGTDVTISTAATSNTLGEDTISSDNSDASGGTITVNDSIVVSGSGSGSLTLIADKDIQINATLQNSTGAGGLTLSSATGVAINSTGSIDWDGGSDGLIQIIASASGGLTGSGPIDMGDAGTSLTISQPSISDTTYSGSISGAGDLTKAGSGELLLSGVNTYQGRTYVEEGVLGISNASALGASGAQSNGTFINRDAALYIIGSENFSLAETLSLGQSGSSGSAKIRLVSGNATLTKPITLFGDSALEALSGELLLDNTSSSSGSNMIAVDSSCEGGQSCSLRIGGNSLGGGGIVKTFWDQSSPSNSDGISLGSENLTINNNGTFRISGASVFSGPIIIDSADLQIAKQGALGQVSSISMVNNAKLSFLTDFPAQSPPSEPPVIVTLGVGDQTLFIASDSSVVLNDVTFSGAGNFVKDGGGVLEYLDTSYGGTGTLAYTGDTKVLAGSLTVSAASIATSSVSCSGTGTSNLCSATPAPASTPTPTSSLTPTLTPEPTTTIELEPVSPGIKPISSGQEPSPPGQAPMTSADEPLPPGEEPLPPGQAPLTKGDEPLPLGKPEQQPEAEVRGVGTGLPAGANGEEKELVDSILLAQAPPEQAPMTSASFTPMEPMASVAPEPGQEGGSPVGDSGFGGEGPGPGVEAGGEGPPDVGGPEGQVETADAEGPPEGGGPEGEGDGPGAEPGGGDGDGNAEMEGADPAALTPPSLSGEGYEVSLSLESSFQMADSGNPSIGAAPVGGGPGGAPPVGGAVDGAVGSQLNAATTAVAEGGGGAAISGGAEGTAANGAGSPEGGVSAAPSGSEGEGASGEAGGEVAAGDGGGEESSGAEGSGSETADAGDGGVGEEGSAAETADGEEGAEEGGDDDGTTASAESEERETADGEAAGEEAAGEEGAAGAEEGPSEKPKAPSAAVAVKRVDAKRASDNLARGDAQATSRTLQGLNLSDVRGRSTPTPAAITNSLQQVRQRIVSGAGPR